jgi:hypothetical protein
MENIVKREILSGYGVNERASPVSYRSYAVKLNST